MRRERKKGRGEDVRFYCASFHMLLDVITQFRLPGTGGCRCTEDLKEEELKVVQQRPPHFSRSVSGVLDFDGNTNGKRWVRWIFQ